MSLFKNILLAAMRRRLRGFGFLTSKLYPNGIIAKNKFGVKMRLNPYEAVEGSVLFDGYFDESVLNRLIENLREGEVFWDVGANVGLHSFTIKKLMPSIECCSFEPYHRNFEKLCFNQSLNPQTLVNKYNLALGSEPGIAKLYSTINNAGRTSLSPLQNSFTTDVYVDIVTGNQLVEWGVSEPHVIKLDTEGTELAILQGCKGIFQRDRSRIVIFESFSQTDEIVKFLSQFGFKVTPIDSLGNFVAIR